LAERDSVAARNVLFAFGDMPLTDYTVHLHRPLLEGVVARMVDDRDKARSLFTAARAQQERIVQAQPDYGPALCVLGLIDAALGRKDDALREGRHAVELVPVEKEAISGPLMIEYLAMIAAWAGDKDLACEELAVAVRPPSTISYGQLKLLPWWDPLRGDPRFEHIVASLAPAGVTNSALEKSIAVLPFDNLSRDPDNAYFAAGVQEEILTRLAKIAELKVISRTSTQRYQSKPRDLTEIANQLGVTNILEGSVQKVADQVRVNVQLVNAKTDSQLWADSYDRKLTDILSVESEVAKAVADQLQATLTGHEEQVIAAKPTDSTEAYDAYLRGLAYTLKTFPTRPNTLAAQKYFKEAVRLDPKFALSWALLSYVDARGYITLSLQPTVALREEARQAAETALALQPNLGEAVLAKGSYYYYCLKEYDTAVRYFEEARQLLPNSSRISELLAYLARRRGQWDRSEAYFNEAERLDPLSASLLVQRATNYVCLRRFPEALRKFDEALNITPDDLNILAQKAAIAQAQGDLPHASALLARLHLAVDNIEGLETKVYQAILERRPAPIIPFIKEILARPDPTSGYFNAELRFWLGWAQEVAGDHVGARESWRQARSEMEPFLKEQPDNHSLIDDLALINMSLGDKAAALALSERAIAVNPIEKDAIVGPSPIEILARVAARMGETDRAIAALQKVLSIPYSGSFSFGVPLTPALLRLDPMFDPLRNDPRFQKLCEEKQP
jgi:TolB-like protein/Flp pilus assembly protein TadD